MLNKMVLGQLIQIQLMAYVVGQIDIIILRWL